jgi:hypothetical protein
MTSDDPRLPLVLLQEQAMAALDPAIRERVIEYRRERDDRDQPTWEEGLEDDPPAEGEPEDSGWTWLMLRPVNPLDARSPIRLGRWPTKHVNQLYADERARAEEHDVDG